MMHVIIVCAAGASSTFLARRLAALAEAAGLDWNVSPSPLETLDLKSADVVAVSSHVATDGAIESLVANGTPFVLLSPDASSPAGAEGALSTIAQFLGKDGERTGSIGEPAISEVTH